MKPFDDSGNELDAIFTVEEASPGNIYLTLESRGGGEGGPRPPRNADYSPALELLLRRLGERRALVRNIEVYSNVTRNWPAAERRINAPSFPLPIDLARTNDLTLLRHELGRASTALGRRPGQKGGNPTKRLRLLVELPADRAGLPMRPAEVEAALAAAPRIRAGSSSGTGLRYGPLGSFLRRQTDPELRLRLSRIAEIIGQPLPEEAWTPQFWSNAASHHASRREQWLGAGYEAFFERRSETVVFRRAVDAPSEEPTDDPDELRARAKAIRSRMEDEPDGGPSPPGSANVRKTSASVTRYVRDPKVIAWILVEAAGRCEVCDEAAPFVDADGTPFLEVHHIRPLGEGGPDRVDNAVASCPNCHRRLHYGRDREAVRKATISKVGRLVDYPYLEAAAPEEVPV